MAWPHFFVAGAIVQRHGLEISKNALERSRQLCIQRSIFEGSLAELLRFGCCPVKKMKKSRRIASFLMLSTSKNEEVSQNCFVFDVVTFKIKEVSQNCCIFDVVKFKNLGSLAEQLRFQSYRQTDRQSERERDKQIDRLIDRYIERKVGRKIDGQIDRQIARQIVGQIDT